MFWIILIVVIIAICAFKAWLNDDSSSSSTSAPPAPAWREPSTPDEHLILLAIVANQLGKYGDDDGKLTEVNMQMFYSWGPDRVSITLRGIDASSVLSDSKAWQYLKSQSTDGTSVEWTFEFDLSKGGAPGHYRGEEWTLQFIRQFAPQAYPCGISHYSSNASWICFGKNDVYLRDIDAEVVRAYTSYRKY